MDELKANNTVIQNNLTDCAKQCDEIINELHELDIKYEREEEEWIQQAIERKNRYEYRRYPHSRIFANKIF